MSKEIGTFHISEIPNGWWRCAECDEVIQYHQEHSHTVLTNDTFTTAVEEILRSYGEAVDSQGYEVPELKQALLAITEAHKISLQEALDGKS